MHLVAIVSSDDTLLRLLWRFRDALGRFHLHPVAGREVSEVLPALAQLDFAGALILDGEDQAAAAGSLRRLSLEAQEVAAVDTVAVTSGGLVGEFNVGRAVGSLLGAAGWDARAARALVLGGGPRAMGVARELSSLGVSQLVLLAPSRPEAEAAAPRVAATTRVIASAFGDPLANTFMMESDLIVRLDARANVPLDAFGPHLTFVDLAGETLSRLRQQALNMGALSFNQRDYDAHFMSLALGHILGGQLSPEPFLSLFHEAGRG